MFEADRIKERIAPMFEAFDDSMINSCFEGVYGELYCDSLDDPKTAVIVSGDFHYLAGEPDCGGEIMALAQGKPHAVFVPCCDKWFDELSSACAGRLKKVERFHMRLAKAGFDRAALQAAVDRLGEPQYDGYELCSIGEKEYHECLGSDWADSFVSNFSDYYEFAAHGFGFVIKHGGKIVSGTSTYCYYSKGVEVEVSTAPQHRLRGLAKITSARFIAQCLDRGLLPNWDARNPASVSIAKKVGFELKDSYTAYEFAE